MGYTAATNHNIPNCTHAIQFPRNVAFVSLTKVKCNTNVRIVQLCFKIDEMCMYGSNLGNVCGYYNDQNFPVNSCTIHTHRHTDTQTHRHTKLVIHINCTAAKHSLLIL